MDFISHLDALVVISEGVMPAPTRLVHHALCCSLILVCLLLLKYVPAQQQ